MHIFSKKFITISLLFSVFILAIFNTVLAAKPEGVGNGKGKPGGGDPPPPPTVIEQIQAELDYIVNSTYTEENINSGTWVFLDQTDDVYGAINNIRLEPRKNPTRGWVRPGEAAMAAVGMMQGTSYLSSQSVDITKYDSVLDKFFLTWALAHGQGKNSDPASPDYGAYMDRIYYNADGSYAAKIPTWKTDVTAQMMIANWKYYEYNVNTGQAQQANEWINNAWPIQQKAADYLVRMHDTTPAGTIHMLPGNSSVAEYNTWIHFAANAVPALRSASAWAKKVSATYIDYDEVADDLVIGIQSMKDPDPIRPNYFKYRPYSGGSYGLPIYGDSIDQLTFSPYETGAVSVDSFTAQISDWWTNGDAQIKMTYQTSDPTNWRYYGTHWHYYFDGRTENNYLYPGPGFQLAKIEWKYGNIFAEPTYTTRSYSRLAWGKETNYSSLWWFLTGQKEANIPNGFQDWRNATNYLNIAPTWARLIDTSSYFIEVLLMNEAGIDTDYNPVMP